MILRNLLNYIPAPFVRLFIFVAILIAVGLAHRPILNGWFQVDDFLWLRLADFRDVLHSFVATWGHGVAYRPIMRISFYLDALLFGWHGAQWHAENLLIAAIDGYLLFVFARRLGLCFIAALAAACLFVAAPINVENIDWISGRTGLLSLAILLGATILWIDGWPDFSRKNLLRVAVLMVVGLATYEAGIVLPLVLAALAPWLKGAKGVSLRRQARPLLLLVAIEAAFWLVRSLLIGTAGAKVDVPMPSVWAALQENIPTYFNVLRVFWHKKAILALVFGIALGTLHARFRLVVWTMLATSGVLVLPFLMAQGWGARFSFAMQAPLCIILVVPLAAIPGKMRYGYLLMIGGILWDFGSISYHEAGEMAQAGRFDHIVIEKAASIPAEPMDTLVFAGIPDVFAGRMAISTKFHDAMTAKTRRPGLTLREEDFNALPDRSEIERTTQVRRFRFNPESQDFTEQPRP